MADSIDTLRAKMKDDTTRITKKLMDFFVPRPKIAAYVRDFNEDGGFMFASSPQIDAISEFLDGEDMTGTMFGTIMRDCQARLRKQRDEEEKRKREYTEHVTASLSTDDSAEKQVKYNKDALNVLEKKGMDAMLDHISRHPETGKPLTYGEMRMLYG